MAYPHRRKSSSDEEASLAPPRPFFVAANSVNRSSDSSFDTTTTSLDPASDSDKDSPPEQQQHLAARVVPRSTTAVAAAAAAAAARPHHRKRSSMSTAVYAPVDNKDAWDPTSLYQAPASPTQTQRQLPSRPPPSSFAFPFQAYPGNPDPGLAIPGLSRRRSSLDSALLTPTMSADTSDDHPLSHSGSLTDLRKPFAPFMAGGDSASSTGSLPRSSSSNSLYSKSAAANMMPAPDAQPATPTTPYIPRNNSVHSFRAPFLSPSSRPNSSYWSPPSYNNQYSNSIPLVSPSASTTALALSSPYAVSKSKPPLPSTRLAAPLEKADKPWLAKRERGACMSYFITILCIFLGLGAAAVICWRGIADVHLLDESNLCQVLSDDFTGGDLDTASWTRDVELGGFGNGEFEMTTESSDNLYIANGQLYLHPTLTSDKVSNVLDGGNYTLEGCKTQNRTACTASSNAARGTVINPVQSARINTKGKKSITFGKVEVRAKLPRGDWLWPAIWMLPEDNTYGAWPASGEIDILEARGNDITYPAQGANFVRSSLNYGPMPAVFNQVFGWWSEKRTPFSAGFHTYTLEWDPKFIRVYVDSRLHAMLEVDVGRGRKKSFWDKAGFPVTAQNGSAQVVVQNPYAWATDAAPFDQSFYLIINLAAGGTSGWFPDNAGGKPWYDGSLTAMRDFAREQDTWSATWPESAEERSFIIDYVRMWERC